MAIMLRSRREIELMRQAGQVVADVLLQLHEVARPGMSTAELDSIAIEMSRKAGADTLFKGVRSPFAKKPFPGAICASINEQIVHGIPSDSVKLVEGDIISVDFGVKLNGYCGDAAVTFGIGEVSAEKKKLMDVTQHVLEIAIERCRPGVKWSQIAAVMQGFAEGAGYSVVRDFVGHGIGSEMHEEPRIPNFVSEEFQRDDFILQAGMVIAIEPMINMGSSRTKTLSDGWTVVTKDRKCSAHFEHTVAIVENGCEVLTLK